MKSAFLALLASRKSLVGLGALALVGAVFLLTDGDVTAKSTAMAAVAGVAMTIIHAIGQEDAASKAVPPAPPEDLQ